MVLLHSAFSLVEFFLKYQWLCKLKLFFTCDEIVHGPITDWLGQQRVGKDHVVDCTVSFVALTDVQTQQVLSGVIQVVQGKAMQERSITCTVYLLQNYNSYLYTLLLKIRYHTSL